MNQETPIRDKASLNLEEFEQMVRDAAWESVRQNRGELLQEAINSYVKAMGHSYVMETMEIPRGNAYRVLSPKHSPRLKSLMQIGNGVIQMIERKAHL